MANDRLNLGKPDRSKINMGADDEVKYWCKHFGVSRDELQKLIEKVGNSAAAVRKELERTESS